jgi:hypothetical protein
LAPTPSRRQCRALFLIRTRRGSIRKSKALTSVVEREPVVRRIPEHLLRDVEALPDLDLATVRGVRAEVEAELLAAAARECELDLRRRVARQSPQLERDGRVRRAEARHTGQYAVRVGA